MTKKKDDDKSEVRQDLTRLEDLSTYEHEDDPTIDHHFANEIESEELPLLPEEPEEIEELATSEETETAEETLFFEEEIPIKEEMILEEEPLEEEALFGSEPEAWPGPEPEAEAEPFISPSIPEKLEEITTFQQYYQEEDSETLGPADPPYSAIITHISPDDHDLILSQLRECEILNANNENDFLESLTRGSLLVSRISEFQAIQLIARLKRLDLHIKAGLHEETRPSKEVDDYLKGLPTKKSITQNKEESQIIQELKK